MAAHVGKTFRISTHEGNEFEGILHSLDVNSKKISLMKVSVVPSGKRLTGLLHFYGQEIANLAEVNKDEDKKVTHKMESPCASGDEDAESLTQDEAESPAKATDSFVYLPRLGAKFRQAVDLIRSQQLIGVCTEAERLSRRAKLSLVQICCRNQVFVFDVLSLGPAVFTEGLADILESPAIVKVMHDSRWASDQIYHQYSVKLTNVYDTQAADVLIRMRRWNGELPHKLSSLPECLLEYLDISMGEVYPQWLHDQARETKADTSWLERPLSPNMLSLAVSKVRHLPELRVMTLHHLLAEFTASVDVFLSCIRDMPDMTRSKTNASPSVIPRQLERLVYGNLPLTDPPSSTSCDPLRTESLNQSEPEKARPSPHNHVLSVSNPSNKKPSSDIPLPATPKPTGNGEEFCTPTIPIHKTTTPEARLANGVALRKDVKSTRSSIGSTANPYSTFTYSPKVDVLSVVKVKREGLARTTQRTSETASAVKKESADGFWDAPEDLRQGVEEHVSRGEERGKAEESSLNLGQVNESDTSGGYWDKTSSLPTEEISGTVANEDDNNDEDNKDDDDDDDDEEEEITNNLCQAQTQRAQQANVLKSLSPRERPTVPAQITNNVPQTKRRTLADNYLTSIVTIPKRTNGAPFTSRLYSRALKDAGMHGKGGRNGDALNVNSLAQFPELDHDVQEKKKKDVCEGDASARPDTLAELERVDELLSRQFGAVPKMPSSYPTRSDRTPGDGVGVTQRSPQGVTNHQMTSAPVGRGRARMLACHEDMLKNVRRPTALQVNSHKMQQYDFPSQEDIARVPKSLPNRASDYAVHDIS